MGKRKRYLGRDVVCPWFRREEERAMVCNGCWPNQWVRVMFQNPKDKKNFMAVYCNTFAYGGCPYAQAAEMAEEAVSQP